MSIFLLAFSLVGKSQDYVDLLKTHYAVTPENTFDSVGGSSTIVEYGADLTLPVVLSNKKVLITGLAYENIKLKLHPVSRYEHLTSISLKLGMQFNHSDKVSGTYMLLPKLASDMHEIGSDDFQLGGLALFKIKKSTTFKYHAGLYYNNELFGPFLVPLFGFYYKSPNNRFEANFTLPIWADLNYKVSDWMHIGTNFSAFVRSYNLSESNGYVSKKTNEIFGYIQFNVKKSLILQAKGGYSIGRSYQVYTEKTDFGLSAFRFGDNRTALNPAFSDGFIFQVRLLYRFDLSKNENSDN